MYSTLTSPLGGGGGPSEEALQKLDDQVRSGACRISNACPRLYSIIKTVAKDESTRPFLPLLPRLLDILLGDKVSSGWIEMISDEESFRELWSLITPNGILFTSAILHSGHGDVDSFGLSLDKLPAPLAHKVATFGPSSAPTPLDKYFIKRSSSSEGVEGANGPSSPSASFLRRLGGGKEASTTAPLSSTDSFYFQMNSAEYFIWRLLGCLLTLRKHAVFHNQRSHAHPQTMPPSTNRKHSLFNTLSVADSSLHFRWSTNKHSNFYQRIIDAYLQYFLPISTQIERNEAEECELLESTAFSLKYLKTSSGLWGAERLAKFFFCVLNEQWLRQSEYSIQKSGGEEGANNLAVGNPPFVMPSIDHLECIQLLTRHLVIAICNPARPPLAAQLVQTYDEVVEDVFVAFRPLLYRFLRMALDQGASLCDHGIIALAMVWFDFCTPWRYLSLGGGSRDENCQEWSKYIANNYFFYHTIIGSLLEGLEAVCEAMGTVCFEEEGAGSKEKALGYQSLDNEQIKNSLKPILLVTTRTLAAISPFLQTLCSIEAAELTTVSALLRTTLGPGSMAAPKWFIQRQSALSHAIKEQLEVLEDERFVLRLLWSQEGGEEDAGAFSAMKTCFWLEKIFDRFENSAGGGGGAAKGDRAREGQQNVSLASAAHEELFFNVDAVESEALIMQCEEELTAFFSISPQKYSNFSKDFETRLVLSRTCSSSPLHSSLRLSQRQHLVKRADARTIKSRKYKSTSSSSVYPIRSYEIAWLVHFTNTTSYILNDLFWRFFVEDVLEEAGWIKTARALARLRLDLRWLAAKPNLIFIGLLVSLAFLIWNLFL